MLNIDIGFDGDILLWLTSCQVWLFMTAGLLRSVCVQVAFKASDLKYDHELVNKSGVAHKSHMRPKTPSLAIP